MSSAEWTNVWLFSIWLLILLMGFGAAYRIIRIDKNLETLVAIQQTNNVSQSVLTINTK